MIPLSCKHLRTHLGELEVLRGVWTHGITAEQEQLVMHTFQGQSPLGVGSPAAAGSACPQSQQACGRG